MNDANRQTPTSVFDMGCSTRRPSSILLGSTIFDALKKHITEARDASVVAIRGTIMDLAAIRIYVEDDPIARKARAITEVMEGRSCLYEGKDGELIGFSADSDPDLLFPVTCPTMKPTPPQPNPGILAKR